MNERTRFFIKKYISHFYSRKGWSWLCVRGELETGTDCCILTPSSSDDSYAFWLGCSTVGHWRSKPSVWSWFSLRWHPISNWLQLQLELELTQAVCGTWLYNCLTPTWFLWAYASSTITEFNHVHRSRWYSDILDRMHLFHCSSAYLHRYISWLTTRSRVNMLQSILMCYHKATEISFQWTSFKFSLYFSYLFSKD